MLDRKIKWIGIPLLVVAVSATWWWCWYHPVYSVVMVRHAEKGGTPPQDPPLTAAGHTRAEALLHAVKDSGINVVIASQFQRTQQTVQPTAAALGLIVNEIDAGDIAQIVQQATSTAGGFALVCGHSNTVPEIIEALGGGPMPALAEDEFDNLFIVTKRWWHGTTVLHLNYGESD